jgi:hypothetical protein
MAQLPTKSLPSNLARQCGRATLQGRAADQPSTKQPCKAERPTSSLPSNPARWSSRPTHYQATQQGGAADQLTTEQPYRATQQGGVVDQLPIGQPSEAEAPIQYYWPTLATTKCVLTKPRPDQRHDIPKRRQEVTINTTKRHHVQTQAYPHYLVGPVGVLGPTAHPGLPLEVLFGVGRCYRL